MRKEFREQELVSSASWVAPRCIERGGSRLAKGSAPVRRAYRKATNPQTLECVQARLQRLAVEMLGTTPVVVKVEFRVPETLAPVGWWDSGWFDEWLKIAREGKG